MNKPAKPDIETRVRIGDGTGLIYINATFQTLRSWFNL